MKRLLFFLGAIITATMLSSCGLTPDAAQITMADIANANQTDVLLEKHGRLSMSTTLNDQPEAKYYAEKDGSAMREFPDGTCYTIVSDDCHYLVDTDGFGSRQFSAGANPDIRWYDNMAFDQAAARQETISDIQESEDRLTVTARLDGVAYDELLGMDFGTTKERVSVYTVDARTLQVYTCTNTLISRDGTVQTLVTEVDYNPTRPENLNDIIVRATQTINLRTVTVVLDPNTDSEKVYSVSVPKGDGATPCFADNYGDELYLDAECTQRYYGGTDMTKDVTIYVPRND